MSKRRRCSVTNEIISEGFVIYDGEMHAKDEASLITAFKSLGFEIEGPDDPLLKELYAHHAYYWTNWDE